jgi:hypothetical protein
VNATVAVSGGAASFQRGNRTGHLVVAIRFKLSPNLAGH